MRSTASIPALASVLIALALAVGSPTPTAAEHGGRELGSWGDCRVRANGFAFCNSVGNNLRHYVYFDSTLTPELASSLRDTMAEDYGATDLRLFEQQAISAVTDVVAYSQDYGDNGAAGWVNCPATAQRGTNPQGDRWCLQQEIHFNLNPRFAVFVGDDASRDHVACHEMGHTLGLGHWGNPPLTAGPIAETCMNANTPDGPVDLHEIDRQHIDEYEYEPVRAPRGFGRMDGPICCAGAATAMWGGGAIATTELERYDSLGDMVRSADAVVLAEAVAVRPGRVFGDSGARRLHYAAVTLRVDEVIGGALPGEHSTELTLEVPLFDGSMTLDTVKASLLGDRGTFFLRNKGESARGARLPVAQQRADAEFYRLVVSRAVILDELGQAALPPGDRGFLDEFIGEPFQEVLRLVRDAAR